MITLSKIEAAVKSNVIAPTPKDRKKLALPKRLQASQSAEGNSHLGIVLFVGIAAERKFEKNDIKDHISIEFDKGFYSKLTEYGKLYEKNERFRTKVKLINNYLKFYG